MAGARGGAIWFTAGQLLISGCTFTRNRASSIGGAVCLEEIGSTTINSNFIENASGGYAGTLAYMPIFSGTPLTLDNATFINNSAEGSAGAVYARPRWPVTITNTIFINNSASEAGAVQLYNRVTLTVINCSFTDNKAIVGPRQCNPANSRGGAIIAGGEVWCIGSNFTRNAAYSDGGAISLQDDFYSEKCTFTNNSAFAGSGGVVYGTRRQTTVLIVESTFSYNTALFCGVADMLTNAEGFRYNLTIMSSLFMYNGATDNTTVTGGGGVACIRNASISVTCSAFSHNMPESSTSTKVSLRLRQVCS